MPEVVNVKAHCNSCLKETKHVLVAEKKTSWSDEEWAGEMHGDDSYQIVECCGCGTVGFRRVSTGTQILDEEGNFSEEVTYFPAAVSRRKPEWLGDWSFRVDEDIESLLNEIYVAIHEDLRVIAGNGIRTVLDMVMTNKIGDLGGFPAKLSAIESAGLISTSNKEFLKVTIDAGSASAHRAFKPTQQDLNLLLDIAENLISAIYILPDQVKALSKKVPPRPKTVKNTGN